MVQTPRTGLFHFVIDNSILLVAGTLAALIWANIDEQSYNHFAHAAHFTVNDLGMVFFFGLAAKEVYEAMLPGGALSSPRQAAVPILAAAGGMAAPALIYLAIVAAAGQPELARGWAIPCATDIAFSYMVARLIFPAGHAAIPFLLLLAIADDALGLIILALFYPSGELSFVRFAGLMASALAVAYGLRRFRIASHWPYTMGAGALSWAGLFLGGFHPALALVPIVPFMPHARGHAGPNGDAAHHRVPTLAAFEHWWRVPVQFILFLFGFVNAGVPVANVGVGTWAVLAGLFIGKPLGITLFTVGAALVGFERSRGLAHRDVVVLGLAAAIGFTVALFFATAAFPGAGAMQDHAKMGALLSFFAAPAALGLGRALGITRQQVS